MRCACAALNEMFMFRPPQKKVNNNIKLKIDNKDIKEMKSIKYLGVCKDCHLKWKEHILEVSKKTSKRNWHFT